MKLSDFRGKRGAKAFAELMRLGESVSKNPLVEDFLKGIQDKSGTELVGEFCKLSPILDDDEVLDAWVSIIAKVKKLPEEEVAEEGDLFGELLELFTSDVAVGRFFASSATAEE